MSRNKKTTAGVKAPVVESTKKFKVDELKEIIEVLQDEVDKLTLENNKLHIDIK